MLKPWAQVVVTLWVLLVVPLMPLTVLVTVLSLPRILATAAASLTTSGRRWSADSAPATWWAAWSSCSR